MDSTKKRQFMVEVVPKHWVDQESMLEMATALREFRLEALRATPDAFASTYETEVQYPMGQWLQRLKNPDAWHIVATEHWEHDGSEKDQGYNSFMPRRWFGMILVMAKRSMKRESAASSPWIQHVAHTSNKLDKQDSEAEQKGVVSQYSHYQLHGTFVHPSARRCGIGTRLTREALSFVKAMMTKQALPTVRVDVLVDSENTAAKSLYQSCGFQFVECDKYQVGSTKRTALGMSIVLHINT